MSQVSSIIKNGLTSLEIQLGSLTCEYSGTSSLCVPSTLKKGSTVNIGGMEYPIDLTLIIREEQVGQPLVFGNTIIYNSKEYTIQGVDYPAGSGVYEVHVADRAR